MIQTKDEGKGSIKNASEAERRHQQEKKKNLLLLKRANHKISWAVGVVFALIPILVCWLNLLLYSDNEELVAIYAQFISEFFSSGSFLWVSITVLTMSLLELLLYGFKDGISERKNVSLKIFLIITVFLVGYSGYLYISNIGNPISENMMNIVSWVVFILFAISSGYISFKIVKVE